MLFMVMNSGGASEEEEGEVGGKEGQEVGRKTGRTGEKKKLSKQQGRQIKETG